MKMEAQFKRVPALDKCFDILEFLARSQGPVGVSELSKATGYHRSTVFNMLNTLADLHVLSKSPEKKFSFGLRLYSLGRTASDGSDLIPTIHPYLVQINRKTDLSTCLGIRADSKAVIVDKVDSDLAMKISMDEGIEVPLLAGAGGKALLSLLPDAEIDRILAENPLKKVTPLACVNKTQFKKKVEQVRVDGIAFDREGHMEGMCALAVPLNLGKRRTQAAIWSVGLKTQFRGNSIRHFIAVLKETAENIAVKFSVL
jgi:IclR family transcriptional regulator, KDG regulon repressor